MMRVLLLALLACLLLGGRAEAGCPPLPYVFVPGTTADANQVNANFNAVTTCAGAGSITVANLAALRAACTSTTGCPAGHPVFLNGAIRLTDGVAGAPPLYFSVGSGACSTDDGASCVNSANGNQWDGVFPTSGADVRQWGAVGDGSTNALAAFQAAATAVSQFGGTLIIPAGHLFNVPGTVTVTKQIHIIQASGPPDGNNTTTCPNGGIIDEANTDLLVLNGTGSGINGVCFVLGTAGSPASGGRAIVLGPSGTNIVANMYATNNTLYYPYVGIAVGGATWAGNGSTGTVYVQNNIIIRPVSFGATLGLLSAETTTADITFTGNTINCGEVGTATAVGIFDANLKLFDGNELLACQVNTAVEPGTGANSLGQTVLGNFGGIIGDTATLHNLVINATTSLGRVRDLTFSNWWAGQNVDGAGSSILIENTGGTGNQVEHISFVDGVAHGSNTSQCIFDLEGVVNSITVVGNQIGADIVGTGDTGLCDNATGVKGVIWSNNDMSTHQSGTELAVAVNIGSAAGGNLTITGNNFANATTPMVYSPTSASFVMTEANNYPLDSTVPTVADAATINVGLYDNTVISGTGTTITSMGPVWAGRKVTIIPSNAGGITVGPGGTNPFCFANTSLALGVSHTYTWISANCWM